MNDLVNWMETHLLLHKIQRTSDELLIVCSLDDKSQTKITRRECSVRKCICGTHFSLSILRNSSHQ